LISRLTTQKQQNRAFPHSSPGRINIENSILFIFLVELSCQGSRDFIRFFANFGFFDLEFLQRSPSSVLFFYYFCSAKEDSKKFL